MNCLGLTSPKNALPLALVAISLVAPGRSVVAEEDVARGFVTATSRLQDAPRPEVHTTESLLQTWPGPLTRTLVEIVASNELVWLYGRYVRDGGENPEFRVSWRSISEQLKYGWEWDDNSFPVNHLGHPYQGNLYYTAARANGYGYEQSILATFLGSFLWEYTGEVNHPAVNDWINTSLGGIALGEAAHRVSDMILDSQATGWERFWREIGAAAVEPIRAVNRLLTGEFRARHANPVERTPEHLSVSVDFGARALSEGNAWNHPDYTGYLRLGMRYGDAFRGRNNRPFDSFDLSIQLNPGESGSVIGRIESAGFLYWRQYERDNNQRRVLGFVQHFDYYENAAFQFGNQSISATWLSELQPAGIHAAAVVHVNAVILGASKSDYFNISGREYDYGPGLGTKLGISFGDRRMHFTASSEAFWIHSVNGNAADHFVGFSTLKGEIPVRGTLGVAADYRLYLSERVYRDFPDVSEQDAEIRGYMTLEF